MAHKKRKRRIAITPASHSKPRRERTGVLYLTSFIKSNPREGVKKNLSEISETKSVWPLGGIGGMDSGDLQSGFGGVGRL
jgi:hypothetical protein